MIRSVLRAGGAGTPTPGICAVLKQDGYGLGAARVAKRLSAGSGEHGVTHAGAGSGVEMLATYTLDEARGVYESIPRVPILVLMPVYAMDRMDPLYRAAAEGRLHLVVHDHEQFRFLNDLVNRLGLSIPVHVQVDTGLSRGGESPEAASALVQEIVTSQRLLLSGVMTHFSAPCCDRAATREQTDRFGAFMGDLRPILREAIVAGHNMPRPGGKGLADMDVHMANSCATFRSREYHGTMVRVGQCLYGFVLDDIERGTEESEFEFLEQARKLECAVRWVSYASHVQEIQPGWPVGYGSAWKAPKRLDGKASKIAIVPIGYADGYPRTLGGASEKRGGGPGWVGFTGRAYERRAAGDESDEINPVGANPRVLGPSGAFEAEGSRGAGTIYAPVVGRVSMDQITVDVTDVPEGYLRPLGAGSGAFGEVEIYGRDKTAPNYLPTLAHAAHSITHELLCRVSGRVERVYRYPSGGGGSMNGTNATNGTHAAGAAYGAEVRLGAVWQGLGSK